jgi:glycosyltransferase involved in cell wall biosynthesis
MAFTRKAKKSTQGITWNLRVQMLVPYLRAHNILVETCELPVGWREKRRALAGVHGYDIGWIHRHIMWPPDLWRLANTARFLVFDYDDPVCFSAKNPGNWSLSRWLKFRATLRRCSGVLAATDRLVELARPHNRNVTLVPLCADPRAYSMRPIPRSNEEPFRLLWLGSKGTFPYLAVMREHLEAIGKACAGVELVVVGHSQLELEHLAVANVAWSRQTQEEQLGRCHLGLVPLPNDRWAQGKAALKPLQYMASGMPFLGTRVGVNVRLADGGQNGLLADTPAEWVAAVQALQSNESLRLQMAERAIATIRDYHSPDVLADQVASFFRSIVQAGTKHRSRSA